MSETFDLEPENTDETFDLEPPKEDETFDLEPPKKDEGRYVPGQPLPRLWKTEPDPDEDADETIEQAGKKKPPRKKDASAAAAAPAPRSPSKSKTTAKPARSKKKADDESKGEKKVLLEETPTFDTIESRQRVRMAIGGLMVFCVLIMGWIVYGILFPGSNDLGGDAGEMPTQALNLPAQGPSREPEAAYMLDRAREYAKRGQTVPAVAMLNRIVSVYKGTMAAAEAQAALNRPGQNLPLFPDRPFLLAQKTVEGSPSSPASPPATPKSTGPGFSMSPVPTPLPPPRVAGTGTSNVPPGNPGGTSPPPGSTNPGTVAAAPPPPPSGTAPQPNPDGHAPPPAPSTNQATVATATPGGPIPSPGPASPPTQPGPAMSPNIASNAPPPRMPAVAPSAPPSAPAPSPAPGVPNQPGTTPPAGPGEAAILIPANGEHANTSDRSQKTAGRVGRTLPPGFRAKSENGMHESGWPMVIVGERDGATMVLVPGATFLMGDDRGEPVSAPAHPVQLSTYYIDQHEVTNRQFRNFLEITRYRGQPPGKWLTDSRMKASPDEAPAVFVSYQDAEEYAIWAQKRLPTEAQWELAARSADGRRYPWGDEPPRWSRPRKFQQIDPVMSYTEDVSPYGVFDLAGNTVEWVRDWYDPGYYARLRDKTTLDPTGPPGKKHGIQRVVRGMSRDWLMFARSGMNSDRRSDFVGFRCSLAVEGGEASAVIAPHPPKTETPQPGTPPPGQPSGNDVPF